MRNSVVKITACTALVECANAVFASNLFLIRKQISEVQNVFRSEKVGTWIWKRTALMIKVPTATGINGSLYITLNRFTSIGCWNKHALGASPTVDAKGKRCRRQSHSPDHEARKLHIWNRKSLKNLKDVRLLSCQLSIVNLSSRIYSPIYTQHCGV
jgi:hypothetical protein